MARRNQKNRYDVRNYKLMRVRVQTDDGVSTVLTVDIAGFAVVEDEAHDQLDFTVPSSWAVPFLTEVAESVLAIALGRGATMSDPTMPAGLAALVVELADELLRLQRALYTDTYESGELMEFQSGKLELTTFEERVLRIRMAAAALAQEGTS